MQESAWHDKSQHTNLCGSVTKGKVSEEKACQVTHSQNLYSFLIRGKA